MQYKQQNPNTGIVNVNGAQMMANQSSIFAAKNLQECAVPNGANGSHVEGMAALAQQHWD